MRHIGLFRQGQWGSFRIWTFNQQTSFMLGHFKMGYKFMLDGKAVLVLNGCHFKLVTRTPDQMCSVTPVVSVITLLIFTACDLNSLITLLENTYLTWADMFLSPSHLQLQNLFHNPAIRIGLVLVPSYKLAQFHTITMKLQDRGCLWLRANTQIGQL